MPQVPEVTRSGPRTYEVAEAVIGGQVVEGRASSLIGVAGAGSVKHLGVALGDAVPRSSISTTPSLVNGRYLLGAVAIPYEVSVAYSGEEVPVVYAAQANFGDPLICAAAGQVVPAGANPDGRTIVGKCTAPAGVASGATGLMRIA